jgi:hypothetical protein
MALSAERHAPRDLFRHSGIRRRRMSGIQGKNGSGYRISAASSGMTMLLILLVFLNVLVKWSCGTSLVDNSK